MLKRIREEAAAAAKAVKEKNATVLQKGVRELFKIKVAELSDVLPITVLVAPPAADGPPWLHPFFVRDDDDDVKLMLCDAKIQSALASYAVLYPKSMSLPKPGVDNMGRHQKAVEDEKVANVFGDFTDSFLCEHVDLQNVQGARPS